MAGVTTSYPGVHWQRSGSHSQFIDELPIKKDKHPHLFIYMLVYRRATLSCVNSLAWYMGSILMIYWNDDILQLLNHYQLLSNINHIFPKKSNLIPLHPMIFLLNPMVSIGFIPINHISHHYGYPSDILYSR